ATKITLIKPVIPNNCEMTALLVSQYSLRERQTYRHRERDRQREREREREREGGIKCRVGLGYQWAVSHSSIQLTNWLLTLSPADSALNCLPLSKNANEGGSMSPSHRRRKREREGERERERERERGGEEDERERGRRRQ